jgi:hypothetical protein
MTHLHLVAAIVCCLAFLYSLSKDNMGRAAFYLLAVIANLYAHEADTARECSRHTCSTGLTPTLIDSQCICAELPK